MPETGPPASFRIDGEVAIITGASRGIGLAIANAMADAGGSVVISSRDADACATARDAIVASGGSATSVACNTGKDADLAGLVDHALAAFGRIDHIVMNAASNPFYGDLIEIDDGAWRKIMDTNVRANWQLARLALPHMAKQAGGSISIISSIGALRASRGIAAYNVSKAADIGLARGLAFEWGSRNIRVNAIAPGIIQTKFAEALWSDPQRAAGIRDATPLRRLGEPADIAGVALFLASPAARFITGQTIIVDGGATMVSPGL